MLRLTCLAALFPLPAMAEVPKVVADIAPVHSLVAQVMQSVGTPALLLAPNVSPHHATLRPSQANALQQADLVVMIGEGLTPSLPGLVTAVAGDARVLDLLSVAPVQIETDHDHSHGHAEQHDAHDHDDHDGHDDAKDDHGEHGHADHADHGHDDHGHKDHDEHEAEEAARKGAPLDPHAWLDIDNAGAWLGDIAALLSEMDPANAATYQQNAKAAQEELAALASTLPRADGSNLGFLAYHDAYTYFAQRQRMTSLGSLASNEGVAPSAGDIQNARDLLEAGTVACILTEPQFSGDVVNTVTEGFDVTVVSVDPLGAAHATGPELYSKVMADMGAAFGACFAGAS